MQTGDILCTSDTGEDEMSKKIIVISLAAIILVAFCSVVFIPYTHANPENSTDIEPDLQEPTAKPSETESINGDANDIKTPKTIKEKIIELFPDMDPESLKPRAEPDRFIKGKTYQMYENAITKSGKKYRIKVDSDSGEIIQFNPLFGMHQKKGELEISLEDAEIIAQELLRNITGNKADYYTNNSVITSSYFQNTTADVRYTRIRNGIPYMASGINFGMDPMNGDVFGYSKFWLDIENITFPSSEPDITLDEAKEIAETTVNEKYPGTVKSFTFKSAQVGSDTINLCWNDDSELLYYEKEMPIRLVWPFYFQVELNENPEEEQDNHRIHYLTVVDAHSGEIIRLYYKDISIDARKQFREKEID
jgi:uncharacterized membrane protein YkoI